MTDRPDVTIWPRALVAGAPARRIESRDRDSVLT